MKIVINGITIDTKFDWGFKSDADYVQHLLSENYRLEEENKRLKSQLVDPTTVKDLTMVGDDLLVTYENKTAIKIKEFKSLVKKDKSAKSTLKTSNPS